jgi:hypothetical protein
MRATCPAHLIRLDLPNDIWGRVQIIHEQFIYISNQSKQAWDIYTQDGGICFDKFYSYILKSEEF